MKAETFAYYCLKGYDLLQSFEQAFPNQKDIPLSAKQKAIDILLQKPKIKEILNHHRIRRKKGAYTLEDCEAALVSIAEQSVTDFLTVTVDRFGVTRAVFKPVANADLRNIKSIKVKPSGEIEIQLYDRLDAIKAIATIQAAKQGQNTNNYKQIASSLANIMTDAAKRTIEEENEEMFVNSDDYEIE